MPTIIFTTTGDIRSIEFTENFSNTVPKILETPPYPEYFNDTSKLLDSVFSRFYDFSSEMAEIETMSFSLLEAPEESIADFNVLYARVQSLQSRCASILISINREKSEWQSLKSSAARVYKKVQNLIYVNDGICKTLKNQQL
ncbi:MAG: hypothetical protein M0R03_14465, partial [Novosphingobium sp.]|nr:hypothetical protein [Novosphingobium sp.]